MRRLSIEDLRVCRAELAARAFGREARGSTAFAERAWASLARVERIWIRRVAEQHQPSLERAS